MHFSDRDDKEAHLTRISVLVSGSSAINMHVAESKMHFPDSGIRKVHSYE